MASWKSKADSERHADHFDAMPFPAHATLPQSSPLFTSQTVSVISRHMLSYSKVPTVADLHVRGSNTDNYEWEVLSNSEVVNLTKGDVMDLLREVEAQNGRTRQELLPHIILLIQQIKTQIQDHVLRLLRDVAAQNDGPWRYCQPRIVLLISHFESQDPDELISLLYETGTINDAIRSILTVEIIKLMQLIRAQVGEGLHLDLLHLDEVLRLGTWTNAQVSWMCDVLWKARKEYRWSTEEVNEIARLLPKSEGRDKKSSRQIREIIDVFRGLKDVPIMIDGKPVKNEYTIFELIDLLRGVSEFGIGNWTRIHEDKKYTFICRTPLDLKDRFRVSCPQYYPTRSKKSEVAPDESGAELSIRCQSSRGGKDVEYFTLQELKQYRVKVPFFKTDRRGRHDYSPEEDADILAGFHKHNGSWAAIKADPTYKLESRTATDIRDRLRKQHIDLYTASGRCKVSAKVSDASRRPKRIAATKTVSDAQEKKATKKPGEKKPRAPRAPRAKKGPKAASTTASAIAEALSRMELDTLAGSTVTDSSQPQLQAQHSSFDQHCASPSTSDESLHDSPLGDPVDSPSIDYIISGSPPAYTSDNGHEPRNLTATWGAVSLAPSSMYPHPFATARVAMSRSRSHNDPYNNIRLESLNAAQPAQQQQLGTSPNSLPSFATFMAPLVQRRPVTPSSHDDQMECDPRPETGATATAAAGHSSYVPETSKAVVAPVFRQWLAKLN
jgi:hypothetical protein